MVRGVATWRLDDTTWLVASLLLLSIPTQALFGIGAGLVLLLVIGIRAAWDLVTYSALVLETSQQRDHEGTRGEQAE